MKSQQFGSSFYLHLTWYASGKAYSNLSIESILIVAVTRDTSYCRHIFMLDFSSMKSMGTKL